MGRKWLWWCCFSILLAVVVCSADEDTLDWVEDDEFEVEDDNDDYEDDESPGKGRQEDDGYHREDPPDVEEERVDVSPEVTAAEEDDSPRPPPSGPIVPTAEGLVRGTILATREGKTIYSFLGIPYAKPPLGDLRFRPPEAPEPWSGVLDATKDRHRCAQRSHPERLVIGHEDCLHINVYTTRLQNDTKEENLLWAVVVLLHAGGFTHGSGNSIDYCPDNLLDKDVILVAPNYRLGAFGFLSTGDSHAPGNYGLKDQVAALRWVQRNIVYFGGDPDSVTILGAQAGAVSAHYHILSPQSTGLFRNAISQSGTALTPWGLLDGQEARTRAFKLGKLLGCRKNELKDSQALVRCLRMKESGDISRQAVDTVDRVSEISYPFVPVVEPEGVPSPFLPDHPLRLMAENDAGVPWLAGVVRHEGLPQALQAMVFPALMDGLNDETDKFLLQYIGLSVQPKERARSIARKIWNYYFHNDTLEYANLARLADVTTDYHYFYGLAKTVELQGAVSRAPIFVYEFSYSNRESSMVLGVPQGDDTELLFPNIISDVKLKVKKQHLTLFKRLLRIVTNFVRDGHPTLEESEELGSLDWPRARPGELQYLNIDMELEVRTGFYQERMAFWESIHQELLTEYQSYDQIPTPPTKDEL